jgi:hypothetical protein
MTCAEVAQGEGRLETRESSGRMELKKAELARTLNQQKWSKPARLVLLFKAFIITRGLSTVQEA